MYETIIDRPERDPFEALVDVLAEATRYDFVLGIVPIVFAVALVAANAMAVSLVEALVPAALAGVLVVADALYLNPPVDQGSA